MRARHCTVSAVIRKISFNTRKLTSVLVPLKSEKHLIYKIVDIEQLKLHRGIVYRYRQIVCDIVTEGCNGTVVIGSAPLSEEIGEAVDKYPCSRFFTVREDKLLACLIFKK